MEFLISDFDNRASEEQKLAVCFLQSVVRVIIKERPQN